MWLIRARDAKEKGAASGAFKDYLRKAHIKAMESASRPLGVSTTFIDTA
jgi:hypothetical protein